MALIDHTQRAAAPTKVDRLIGADTADAATLAEWLHDTDLSSNEIARRCRQHARAESDSSLGLSESTVRRWREENGVPTCR